MEVILRKDVKELGDRGKVIRVKSGYARNFLIPHGLAMEATPHAKQDIERDHAREQKRLEEAMKEANEMAKTLEKTSCTVSAQANEEGHLFGSVGAAEIAAAFSHEGITVKEDQILLENPIKEIGVYGFKVHVAKGIEVETKVWVVKE